MAAMQGDDQQYVVKRTFIEFAEEPAELTVGRPRACSESALDSFDKSRDSFQLEVEEGLSEADTGADLVRAESSRSDLDSTSDDRSDSRSSKAADQQSEGSEASAEVAKLQRENARLVLENELLRQHGPAAPAEDAEIPRSPLKPASPALAMVPMPMTHFPMSANFMPTGDQMWYAYPGMMKDSRANGAKHAPVWGWNAAGAPPAAYWPRPQQKQAQSQSHRRYKASEAAPAIGNTLPSYLSNTSPSHTEMPGCTTVMLRNLPNNYTRAMVLAMINKEGFAGKYNFLYLPIDFKTRACLGYAFVNLVCESLVPQFWLKFDGYSNWVLPSRKTCCVTWSGPHQGLEAHVERYRDSPVMHQSVPEEYQPLIFQNGAPIPFPAPTRPPRAPRTRNYSNNAGH